MPAPEGRIHPQYSDAFRCIGSACEDTCCQGWTVYIDKESYTKYQTILDGPLRTIVDQRLLLTGNTSDFEFASIKLNEDGACPFLAEDHLCSIQREHGEGYLSLTCSQYPRSAKNVCGNIEQTLLLSCPEAARLVLLHPQLVSVGTVETDSSRYGEFLQNNAQSLPDHFWLVRKFVVLLVQDSSYPLWQRLFLLGMFSKRMEAHGNISALLGEYATLIITEKLRPAMASIPPQPVLQLEMILALVEAHMRSGTRHQRFIDCVQDFASGIGYQPGRTASDLAARYTESYRLYYKPWISKHWFILENYLLNYVLGHLFPFGSPHPHRESLLLCFHYGMIKGLLIGMAGHYRSSFDTSHAVKLIQSYVKAVEHTIGHMQQIDAFFSDNGLNNTTGMATLLRDVS